jgi:predicted flap endonuclease-1-like 5' DNA nuclease
MSPDETPGSELTPSIGKVARRELAHHGYTRYDQLVTISTTELLRIHGVGPKAIRILGEELAARGLGFGPDGSASQPPA